MPGFGGNASTPGSIVSITQLACGRKLNSSSSRNALANFARLDTSTSIGRSLSAAKLGATRRRYRRAPHKSHAGNRAVDNSVPPRRADAAVFLQRDERGPRRHPVGVQLPVEVVDLVRPQ